MYPRLHVCVVRDGEQLYAYTIPKNCESEYTISILE